MTNKEAIEEIERQLKDNGYARIIFGIIFAFIFFSWLLGYVPGFFYTISLIVFFILVAINLSKYNRLKLERTKLK